MNFPCVSSKLTPLIISGPSGCGKTTLINKLLLLYSSMFELSVSHTTRAKRPDEIENVHYYYSNPEIFNEMIKNDSFLEYQNVHSNSYGTSKNEIIRINSKNKIPLLDIDIKGAIYVFNNKKLPDANFLFISPPDIETLRDRLIKRKTETEEKINLRVNNAKIELEQALESKIYNEKDIIVNDDLDEAFKKLINWTKEHYNFIN